MNNIRKIIAEKIANLKDKRVTDYADGFNDGLIEAFKIFLEELPSPRTEQEILKEFEKLGWEVTQNDNGFIILCLSNIARIVILKQAKNYHINGLSNMQEHKLLNELFECYGWL